jgi:hypothetical protein
MRLPRPLAFLPFALAATCFAASDARASEGVKHLGVQAGFAAVEGGDGKFPGFGGAITGRWDLTDAWAIALNATATNNQVAATGGRSWVFSQAAGVVYTLDVIQFVPYIGLYAGVYETTGGGVPKTEVKLGGQVALGIDWMASRSWTFGLELRQHVLPGDVLKNSSTLTPFYTTAFVKAEYAFGWF